MSSDIRTVLGVFLSDARRHKLVTLTTLVGIAIGVAVVVAIRLSSEAALRNFKATHATLTGTATHQITGVEPLPAERLVELRRSDAVDAVQPIVEASLIVLGVVDEGGSERRLGEGDGEEAPMSLLDVEPDDRPHVVQLIGLDPFFSAPFIDFGPPAQRGAEPDPRAAALFDRLLIEPGFALLPRGDLADLGIPDGGTLRCLGPDGEKLLTCAPIPSSWSSLGGGDDDDTQSDESGGKGGTTPLAVVDLATAQELLGLGDRVVRYDLMLAREADGKITTETEAAVPLRAGELLDRAGRRGERADSMTYAFRSNLLALGFLAVLVGAFLVFNMAQFAVTRRRPLLGKLRCLGCRAGAVQTATLLEAGVFGLLGGLLGLLGGRLLAAAMVDDVALTVSTLYGFIETPTPTLDALTASAALAVAIFAAVGATWVPARSAARTPPVLVVTGSMRETPGNPWAPVVFLGLAALALVPTFGGIVLPAGAVLLLLLGVATSLPLLLSLLVKHPPKNVLLNLAAGRIQRSLARTGGAAGALVMPIAMTLGIAIMIGSFQREVSRWVGSSLSADIYVKPLWAELAPTSAALPVETVAALEELDGVTSVDLLRYLEHRAGSTSFRVVGSRMNRESHADTLRLLQGTREAAFDGLEAGHVLISEPLHNRTGKGPGDTLTLETKTGPRDVRIDGVFQDFSYDRGYALMEEGHYIDTFGDTGVVGAALNLRPDVDPDALQASLQDRFPMSVFTATRKIRENVMVAFDNTFAITYVLQAISTALAWVGVLTGLLCLHLERKHELGVLRALGSTTKKVFGLLLTEAVIIVGVAGVVAVPTGAALAWILVEIVNVRSFGWSFPMVFDAAEIASVLVLSLGAAGLAGLVPWLLVKNEKIAQLLGGNS